MGGLKTEKFGKPVFMGRRIEAPECLTICFPTPSPSHAYVCEKKKNALAHFDTMSCELLEGMRNMEKIVRKCNPYPSQYLNSGLFEYEAVH